MLGGSDGHHPALNIDITADHELKKLELASEIMVTPIANISCLCSTPPQFFYRIKTGADTIAFIMHG
jgi:hypothetical protein